MDGRDTLAEALGGLGPADADVQAIVETAQDGWIVRYDDLDVAVDVLDELGQARFTLELGAPDEGRRLDVYKALLNYNLLFRDTGGVVMALGPDGEVVQSACLSVEGWTAERLGEVLQNLLAKGRAWRGLIAQRGGAVEAPAPQDETMIWRI